MRKIILLCVSIFFFCVRAGLCEDYVQLVVRGVPESVIVVSDGASAQVRSAALLLCYCIKRSTGSQLPVLKESELLPTEKKVRIWVGSSKFADRKIPEMGNVDGDGFVISFSDPRNIVILGATDWGTEFGVYEFLESFIGVRWLFPGPNGEHIPKMDTLKIAARHTRQEPAFFSRFLSGLPGPIQQQWARRNRMHERIKFHHNLLNLFPADKYVRIFPQMFPVKEGTRYFPPDNKTHGWQPCFDVAGIVEEAVSNINAYFAQHPEETSYSLGVNDRGGFCEYDSKGRRIFTEKNRSGYADFSNSYYHWANKVVEGVLKTYPDKWFGCLAYREVAQPPSSVKLNPRIVPFITYDRMRWFAPELERDGKLITAQWQKQSPVLGWYDYIYGTPYLVPRVYFHKMADYYKYGHSQGVRAMYAEAYPNWGEGPKLYVALKLQWNPNLDVDELLNDWYVSAVGSNAAPYLREYYQLWEMFWTERVSRPKWFRGSTTPYLAFKHPGYLDVVDYADISKSRVLLEKTVANARTEEQKRRAKMFLRAFEYYEASTISYLGLVKGVSLPGKNRRYFEGMEERRIQLINEFEKDPVLIHPLRIDRKGFERLIFKYDDGLFRPNK